MANEMSPCRRCGKPVPVEWVLDCGPCYQVLQAEKQRDEARASVQRLTEENNLNISKLGLEQNDHKKTLERWGMERDSLRAQLATVTARESSARELLAKVEGEAAQFRYLLMVARDVLQNSDTQAETRERIANLLTRSTAGASMAARLKASEAALLLALDHVHDDTVEDTNLRAALAAWRDAKERT